MQKKLFLTAALALVALAPNAFAQNCGDKACIDVTIRDFPVDRFGFEMFDGNYRGEGKCAGSNQQRNVTGNNKDNNVTQSDISPQTNYRNAICFNSGRYEPCGESSDKCPVNDGIPNCGSNHLRYGGENGGVNKGYCNGPDQSSRCDEWYNAVFVTKGIVEENLGYDPAYCEEWGLTDDVGCEVASKAGLNPCPDYIKYRDCAYPKRGNGDCNAGDVERWFQDIDREHTRVFRDSMVLESKDNGRTFEINFDANTQNNWNGYGNDNGYFPLDKYEGKNDIYGERDGGNYPPFGMQSLNYWCPDQQFQYSNDICKQWWGSAWWSADTRSGPKDGDAARRVAERSAKRHNYGFSMAGSANFKYDDRADDIFEFIGDDDMWIFIDGELVPEGDLGGVHLAAPAKISIKEYAQKKEWTPDSRHVVNFFYMDRNTDGSNMKIKLALTDMIPPRDGKLKITKAETKLKADGTGETIIWVSSRLNVESIQKIIGSGDPYPILVDKPSDCPDNYKDNLDCRNNVYGYEMKSIEFLKSEAGSYMYVITGAVCEDRGSCEWVINSGDYLSFNITKQQQGADENTRFRAEKWGLTDDGFRVESAGGLKVEELTWARNTTDAAPIDPTPKQTDNNPIKPIFGDPNIPGGGIFKDGTPTNQDNTVPGGAGGAIGNYTPNGFEGTPINISQVWDPTYGENGGMRYITEIPGVNTGDGDVHSFGTAGNQIPPQRAGELILTAFPSNYDKNKYEEWTKSEDYKYFGLPPKANNPENGEWWGLADPSRESPRIDDKVTGGYAFVKNGFPNESSVKGQIKVSPTRCTTKSIDGNGAHINCLNFSLEARQPFQIAVTVYDQLGNFITQYREKVTEQEFRNVVQAPNYAADNKTAVDALSKQASTECKAPAPDNYGQPNVLTTNGSINVNVNIYPFSANGRRFGNGVYIVKIDKVDLPFKDVGYSCISNFGMPIQIEPEYSRQHFDKKFGWMRSSSASGGRIEETDGRRR